MKKYNLLRNDDTIIRVLEIKPDRVLIIDCIKKTMPMWVKLSVLDSYTGCTEDELCGVTGIPLLALIITIQTRERSCMTVIR